MSYILDGKKYANVDKLLVELNKPNEKLKKQIGEKRYNFLCKIDDQYHRWIDNRDIDQRPTLVYRLRKINKIIGKALKEKEDN